MLYLTGTPIGNLEDISLRCLRILREVDLIAAEDTRQTQKLLQFYEIKNKLISYHEHNKLEKLDYLLSLLREGKSIALVSDAGMPGISDPGQELVAACIKERLEITTIPGPTALISGLVLSGMDLKDFLFLGFLPADKKERNQKLEEIKSLPYTIILYEAPHRLSKTLSVLKEYLGEGRRISLARELTKKFEELCYMTLEEAETYVKAYEPKGEFVIVIEGRSRQELKADVQQQWLKMSLSEHYLHYQMGGMTDKDILKQMAKDRGVGKREIYQHFHRK